MAKDHLQCIYEQNIPLHCIRWNLKKKKSHTCISVFQLLWSHNYFLSWSVTVCWSLVWSLVNTCNVVCPCCSRVLDFIQNLWGLKGPVITMPPCYSESMSYFVVLKSCACLCCFSKSAVFACVISGAVMLPSVGGRVVVVLDESGENPSV